MSYSFTIQAATKEQAYLSAVRNLHDIVVSQPIHAKDFKAVLENVDSALAVLPDGDSRCVSLGVSGYLSWSEGERINTVSISVTASYV